MQNIYGISTQEIDPNIISSVIDLKAKQPVSSDNISRLVHFPEVFLGSGELGTAIGETVRNIIYSAYLIQ